MRRCRTSGNEAADAEPVSTAARRPARSPARSASALASRSDTAGPGHPREAPRSARRLPHEGRPRPGAVCRQGPEPAQPRSPVLAGRPRERAAAAHRVGDRQDRRRRLHPDRHRQRGAAARGQPCQALPAALQRPPEGRQELPLHQGHARGRLPAHRADPQAPRGRQPLLRAVCVGEQRGRGDEPDPPPLPVSHLHDRHPRGPARPAASLPALPHQALPGPLHRGDRTRTPTARISIR